MLFFIEVYDEEFERIANRIFSVYFECRIIMIFFQITKTYTPSFVFRDPKIFRGCLVTDGSIVAVDALLYGCILNQKSST